ncbi:MAG: beta galactosidase jelly roll domain-containing protein [Treponema sp.]|jgi:beta-galactosidase/beta-glucuronidase|nr:beta galactosidase jelly roll domain-containing protein [Treponema sp.]
MKSYQPGHPRPQFTRDKDSWKPLDGTWDFAFDDSDEGHNGGWFHSFPAGKKITVPFTYEYPASGIGDQSHHDVVWYQRTVELDKEQGRRILLHFEGSDYHTQVWVNGIFTGEHSGAYARFSLDITEAALQGNNRITVRVEDSFDIAQPRGKQRWKDENFGCWYLQNTGIWKSVWIEQIPKTHITGVKMTPVIEKGALEIEVELSHAGGDLNFEALVSFQGKAVNGVSVPALKKRMALTLDLNSSQLWEWGIRSWSPEKPDLYDIEFRLTKNGAALDRVFSYFGMREIRILGKSVLLNGSPLYQRLILDQGYWKESGITPPGEQALIDDIDKIMAAGYNGVRKHQKTEDERFLYWADVKGLLVWSEMAAAYEFNDAAQKNFTREWLEILRQNYNHPSIITWTPFNESWGVPHIQISGPQQHFTEAIYHLTKAYDPYRPVVCNDGWEHTVSDIVTLHDYEEGGEDFLGRYGDLEGILSNRVSHNKSRFAFAQGYSYRGQPVIISEFGGIAFSNRGEGWGYGNKVKSPEEYIKRFDAITTAIKKLGGVSGFCYTQVSDVQQEINGIMDMDRNFKIAPEILKEINTRKIGVIHS